MATEQEKFEAYKSGFVCAITGDTLTIEDFDIRTEYLIGRQDGKEVASLHLNFAKWKEDYERRQK